MSEQQQIAIGCQLPPVDTYEAAAVEKFGVIFPQIKPFGIVIDITAESFRLAAFADDAVVETLGEQALPGKRQR